MKQNSVDSAILISAGYDHKINFQDIATSSCYKSIQYKQSQINRLAISSRKKLLAAAANPTAQLFNFTNGSHVRSFEGHKDNITAIGFHTDEEYIYSSSEDRTAKFQDIRAPKYQTNINNETMINDCLLHPNQLELITADQSGVIKFQDLSKNSLTSKLVSDDKHSIQSISITFDSKYLAAVNIRRMCYIWKQNQEKHCYEFHMKFVAHNDHCLRCIFSSNNKYLATSSADKVIKIQNVIEDFSLMRILEYHENYVQDIVFSSDCEFLFSASSDKSVALQDVETGEQISEYKGHDKGVTCLCLYDRFE